MTVSSITPDQLATQLAQFTLVDVREPNEVAVAAIAGAVLIPLGELVERAGELPLDQPIALICRSGERSGQGATALSHLGFENLTNVEGGMLAWQKSELPTISSLGMSAAQSIRYARHIALSAVGAEGQQKLLDAKVLIVGAGGLGSPAALYLAAAGVGTIGLCDFDHVELSNLQRQIIHSTATVGTLKTESAKARMQDLNPEVDVITFPNALTQQNAHSILEGFDAVIDGTDSFAVRYLINDVAQELGIPVVHGSILRFEGQVTVFPKGGPCYRCLFSEAPPAELAPNCSTAGVLGVLPGVIGSMQATEALKLLIGLPTLIGKLALYDALDQTIDHLTLKKDPACPVCS